MSGGVILKTQGELELMHSANAIVQDVLEAIGEKIAPGVTTGELDRLASDIIRKAGGVAAFLNYKGFPATLNRRVAPSGCRAVRWRSAH